MVPRREVVRAEKVDAIFIHQRELTLRFPYDLDIKRVRGKQHRNMLFGHVLPERVFAVEHARYARLNQQTQRADSLLSGEDELAKIAFSQQRKILIKFQLIAENVQIFCTK